MDSKHLERIEAKIDKLDARLDKVDVRLAKYNAELEFHVARTNQIEDDLLPIVAHVEQIRGGLKLLAAFGTILGLALAVASFIKGK